MNKGHAMAQGINVLQYNRLVFRQRSPLLCGKIGSICGMPSSSRSYDRKAGWLADKCLVV